MLNEQIISDPYYKCPIISHVVNNCGTKCIFQVEILYIAGTVASLFIIT